jgi:hypothetical protein
MTMRSTTAFLLVASIAGAATAQTITFPSVIPTVIPTDILTVNPTDILTCSNDA